MTQTEYEQNIINKAITADRRKDVAKTGNYDIYIEIDCDCEELVDACGLDYKRTEDDNTQNEICISLDEDEFYESLAFVWLKEANEQTIATKLLNPELGEYTTKVTIYKPNGDIISFS
tara:strand:+ start:169 stop:522 length:354 start_codon:yes stop_codon:yes gene_type:complete